MIDVLRRIISKKKDELGVHKQLVPFKILEEEFKDYTKPVNLLSKALINSESGIIAEFKRCSPSKKDININAVAPTVTKGYQDAGAAAISVLTEAYFFGGSIPDLTETVKIVDISVLRKDFIIEEYQILQSRLLGASAILLIAAALTKEEVTRLTEYALSIGLEVLLELHDESELDHISPQNKIIGINNRDLTNFETSIEKSYTMAKHLPSDAVWIAESGISSPNTVKELRDIGYKGFLIGENFMKTEDPALSLQNFIEYYNYNFTWW